MLMIVLGTALAVAVAGLAARSPKRAAFAPSIALPAPVPPFFTPPAPRPLWGRRYRTQWAPVRRPTLVRAAPSAAAAIVAHIATTTPEGTRNIVVVLGHRQDRSRRPWVHVRLAILPNGATGWVPRTALGGYGTVTTRLVIDLERLRATLYRAGRPLLSVAVGIGEPGWSTPRGEFYIRDKLTHYGSPAYGPVAFGTSARSSRATDWPAGGYVGIHGTDRPDLLPGRVSHGCIRMRNADILAVARKMPVGTPVTVR